MTFEIVNICGNRNSKIEIDIYNPKNENRNLYLTNRIKCNIHIYEPQNEE